MAFFWIRNYDGNVLAHCGAKGKVILHFCSASKLNAFGICYGYIIICDECFKKFGNPVVPGFQKLLKTDTQDHLLLSHDLKCFQVSHCQGIITWIITFLNLFLRNSMNPSLCLNRQKLIQVFCKALFVLDGILPILNQELSILTFCCVFLEQFLALCVIGIGCITDCCQVLLDRIAKLYLAAASPLRKHNH